MCNRNCHALKKFLLPTSQTKLRSFLRMCNFCRRFVPNFARTAAPLIKQIATGQSFESELSVPELDAFYKLKEKLFPLLSWHFRDKDTSTLWTRMHSNTRLDARFYMTNRKGADSPLATGNFHRPNQKIITIQPKRNISLSCLECRHSFSTFMDHDSPYVRIKIRSNGFEIIQCSEKASPMAFETC